MRSHSVVVALLVAFAIGVLNLLPNKAAAADDPCTGCFIIAQWYWENEADMSSGEIQEWLAVCLDAHDC
jgi:hypothetical protein